MLLRTSEDAISFYRTQSDLARCAGTNQGRISAIELACKVPTMVALRRIADALNTNLETPLKGQLNRIF